MIVRPTPVWGRFYRLLVVLVVAGWLPGCSAATTRDGGATATTKPATKPSTRPVNETVTVELNLEQRVFTPRAIGLLRPKPATALPAELLSALGPMGKGRDAGGGPPVLVTLGESVKFDGAFPGQRSNWTKWDAGVEALVRQQQAEGRPVIYEIWKEPDKPPFKDILDFYSAWVHTVRRIRAIAPQAVIMGPSISKHDGGMLGNFLKVGKEYDVLPDIVGWHEDGLKHDISGHVGGTGESFWQDGTDRKRVLISANASIDNRADAGDPAIFLAQIEKSAKDNDWRPFTHDFAFKLTHLFTNDMKPRSVYYTYAAYAGLAGAGKTVKVSSSQTVDGLAVWDKSARTGKLLVGRNRSREKAEYIPGTVSLKLKGAAGGLVRVTATRIVNSGTKAAAGKGEEVLRRQAYPILHGEATVPLPDFKSGDAYAIEITVEGVEAVTTKPATRAATAPAGGQNAPAVK